MPSTPHSLLMHQALQLAEKGRGRTFPNPLVGALVVKNGRIVSTGYHRIFGGPHAEAEALRRAGSKAKGAVLYVTLEPCCSFGKTPPCTLAIAEKGIRTVVVAAQDPDRRHQGRGLRELRRRGVRVITGILSKEAARQNEVFFKWAKTGRPFVTLKMAETLDGKIATASGSSRWITGEASRNRVHSLRASHQAVLVGTRTALTDNPRLDVNLPGAAQPVRILLDRKLIVPLHSRVFHRADRKVLAVTSETAWRRKYAAYDRRGIALLAVREGREGLDLGELLSHLGRMGIISLLVEGGGETAARFLDAKLVDKVCFFIAPKILGGRNAPTAVEGKGILRLANATLLRETTVERVGEDVLIEGYPVYNN